MDSKVIGDTVYFWFGVNNPSGQGTDGTTPEFDVRQAGAPAGDAPIFSGTPSLLVNAAYPNGAYEVAILVATANGFAEGNEYAVFCTLLVSGVNPTGFIGSFKVVALEEDVPDTPPSDSGSGPIDSTTLIELATSVAEFESDGQRTKERTLQEIIAMDKHLANRGAGAAGWGSLATHRVVPPDGSGSN